MNLSELGKESVSQMSEEELRNAIIEKRASRRMATRIDNKKVSAPKQSKESKTMDGLIAAMSEEQLEGLLEAFGGSDE